MYRHCGVTPFVGKYDSIAEGELVGENAERYMKRGWLCGVVFGMNEWAGMKCVEMRREDRGVRFMDGIFDDCLFW